MRNRVERLRVWLAGSAVFLLLVIAAFVGSARYLRHLRVKLPEKLGINVVRRQGREIRDAQVFPATSAENAGLGRELRAAEIADGDAGKAQK